MGGLSPACPTAFLPHADPAVPRDLAPTLPLAPLTLGDATEELELHGQAEQVFEQRDPDALHALFMLVVKPAAAAEDGPIHHVCRKGQGAGEAPTAGLEPWPRPAPPTPPVPSREQCSLVFSSYIFCVERRGLGGRAR